MAHRTVIVTNASTEIAPPIGPTSLVNFRLVVNDSEEDSLYLAFGEPASVGIGIKVSPGGSYEMSTANQNWDPRVLNGISDGSPIAALVTEYA